MCEAQTCREGAHQDPGGGAGGDAHLGDWSCSLNKVRMTSSMCVWASRWRTFLTVAWAAGSVMLLMLWQMYWMMSGTCGAGDKTAGSPLTLTRPPSSVQGPHKCTPDTDAILYAS